ncbi:MAG: ureE [Phenylobacterium sp.]|jgi:urease accessory protein|uniref:urease accessory protein UreE n=1 Tax=Phenylobacterium sp. TaxID=1871053 RepID=UPI0026163643|nr:urease accessory protein UreE [Phenylobacterium sp.]MDB5463446.1 ureE [Phenylobacterium sp.]MDB5497231.1 ureE [Phenylobacterium sp.]
MAAPQPITGVLPAKAWSGVAVDRVLLDYDGRHRRRIVLTGESGAQYLLDLPEATHLKGGDGLTLAGGGILLVVAEPEPLLEVRAASPEALTRLAWHIGNRHLAAAIRADRILIRRDHVIAHMLEHQGAEVREVEEPFDPEGGAYHDHGPADHHHDH